VIPRDYITAWRSEAPWVDDAQVEQDLVISKALVDIFSNSDLKSSLAFRGGTALYKLFLKPAARYSEDIDLVQIKAEAAGPVMDTLHQVLDPWLGKPKYKQGQGRVTFVYRFESEENPPRPLRLKIEINTREHFSVYGFKELSYSVSSRWFEGSCNITTYDLNELLGTKMRALYQRKKGRDLFDLGLALDNPTADPDRIIESFLAYIAHENTRITRQAFEANLEAKLSDKNFISDIGPLLVTGFEWDADAMANSISDSLISRLPE